MSNDQHPIDKIIEALGERAKELRCLYRVDETLDQRTSDTGKVLRELTDVIPLGYQYPELCRARITFDGAVFEPAGLRETEWMQSASIVAQGVVRGYVEVYYTQSMQEADEGPFLKEERRLIDTIAGKIAHYVIQRTLQDAYGVREGAQPASGDKPMDWSIVVDYLRDTDRNLLIRLSRKMLNHLCWNGVEEAHRLIERFAPDRGPSDAAAVDDNVPVEKRTVQDLLELTEETFRIAAAHLSHAEIVKRLQQWIEDDKTSYLLDTLENPAATMSEMTDAMKRFRLTAVAESELAGPLQTALRVALVRRFFSDDLDFVNAAKNYIAIADFEELAQRVISPPVSHGKLGGKSSGLFLAGRVVRKSPEYAEMLADVKLPKTWYITSDGVIDFIQHNHLEDVYNRKYLDLEQVRREYPHIVQVFKNSHFSPHITEGLSAALDDIGERPLIVRSSSLLEDRTGSAFSGKYKSLFLANQGSKRERLSALHDAVAEVYASIFGPDPIEYRAERGMLDLHEEMGIMIQEVVGTKVGDYYFPAFSGVLFSNNEFRWSPRIKRDDGLIRLVPGLGTRAVDRIGDDFPVLVAPGQPGLRANVTPDEIIRYAPKRLDVINLATRSFESVSVGELLREQGSGYPMIGDLISVVQDGSIRRPLAFQMDFENDDMVFTFEGLISRTPFVARMRTLVKALQEKLGAAVDVEFAHDGKNLYLLQCRPQSHASDAVAVPIPADLPQDRIVFTANRFVSNGRVPDLTHIVYVDPAGYRMVADLNDMREIGRAVGKLNKLLPKRQFILMGPGRWGSRGDIKLGVSVTYSDINNTAALVEIARREGNYVPDLSFGTHFFQDLVEASIRYLPLYPDEPDNIFNEGFLTGSANILTDLLPEHASLSDTLRVIDVPKSTDGLVLRVLMNADQDRAVAFLATPTSHAAPAPARRVDRDREKEPEREKVQEAFWPWRARMAERIASELEAARFGIRGVYLFGSTKNGTAGPNSDIDLLVHFAGTPEQKRELDAWLEGWSLCLAEMNFLRTGYQAEALLDVHYVSDDDIANKSSYAVKIGAVTDPAKPLPTR